MKRKIQPWWIVVVNGYGVSGPIKCYRPSDYEENVLWDKSGNWECDMRAGIWPLSGFSDCTKFQSPVKAEAETFAAGARAVGKVIKAFAL